MAIPRRRRGDRNGGAHDTPEYAPDINLNLNVRGMMPSATLAIQERCAELRAQHREVFRLGLGQSPFPVPRPVIEELQANAHQKDYLPVRGLPALREAVADYYLRSQGVPRTPDDVIIGPGSKELMFILQLVYYGDIVIPSPAWVSYAPQARIVGRQIQWVHTLRENGWRLTPADLENVCRDDPDKPRIVVLNYPSNPTGCSYTVEELEALARVAREYRVVLLSDEIYGELDFQGSHVSIARFYPEGTIISSGLSKWCGAGGWRLGTFTFPENMGWLLEAMAAVASETYTSTSTPIQCAAVRAFRGGTRLEEYLWISRRILGALGTWSTTMLRDAGALLQNPTGAFYLFPDFAPLTDKLAARGIRTSRALCEKLLDETGVAMLPGSEFGRPATELTARIAYVDFDGAKAHTALATVPKDTPVTEEFLRTHCDRTVRAIELLCDWLKG
ncbi:MAG: aminotransferase class I/II-fold pyridoxal phosphate-dependent enzyme [Candidatus Krumholzibacteria bacterium]|nr:aminotransferase class I/II-fold pyridoxal phosphate-dependent enzyme [Candidatus Krumholzibacteria bacterium]MDH4337627.1 aminotransferase class I/II-fold pyridoxal phosphate-dependent enzyme [Candidatus Krumholzibacteria bacterium]MDH5270429.1 aminotransferase class I/II-fold pyridoxal phosphate-dependent enzyme [Candidatus Krumholzibacteria bacterium]